MEILLCFFFGSKGNDVGKLEVLIMSILYHVFVELEKCISIHIIHNLSLILLQYLFSTCMCKLIHVLYLKKYCIAYLHILFGFLNSVKSSPRLVASIIFLMDLLPISKC